MAMVNVILRFVFLFRGIDFFFLFFCKDVFGVKMCVLLCVCLRNRRATAKRKKVEKRDEQCSIYIYCFAFGNVALTHVAHTEYVIIPLVANAKSAQGHICILLEMKIKKKKKKRKKLYHLFFFFFSLCNLLCCCAYCLF